MSTTSPSLNPAVPMKRRSESLTLGSNPIVFSSSDRRLVDFEETRFRHHALSLQKSLKPLATELSAILSIPLSDLETLSSQDGTTLSSGIYCTFDFLDVQTRTIKGFQSTKWMPFVVFVKGERVLSIHAKYDSKGARLSGITMRRDGVDEYTKCTSANSTLKVSKSYLRTYVLEST